MEDFLTIVRERRSANKFLKGIKYQERILKLFLKIYHKHLPALIYNMHITMLEKQKVPSNSFTKHLTINIKC